MAKKHNQQFWSKLVKFDKIADVLCYYCWVNAAYGDLSKCKKTHTPADPSFEQIRQDHPIIKACHEKCDTEGDPPTKWFQFERCQVQGCCVPNPNRIVR